MKTILTTYCKRLDNSDFFFHFDFHYNAVIFITMLRQTLATHSENVSGLPRNSIGKRRTFVVAAKA